jgi:2',3'-cyclic-nucleotide 2'-phosphodiesterase/3'-nucleotidase
MRAKGAQLVIAIPHSGFEKTATGARAENGVAGLAEVSGIDSILFGHSHAEFPSKAFAEFPKADVARGTINGVAAVMPGRWGDHLGIVNFTLDNSSGQWKVVQSQSSIRPIFDRAAKKSLAAADPSVQIVSNAQTAYVKRAMQGTDYEKYPVLSAAAPFKSGGRQGWSYYTDIPAGPLAIKNVADL